MKPFRPFALCVSGLCCLLFLSPTCRDVYLASLLQGCISYLHPTVVHLHTLIPSFRGSSLPQGFILHLSCKGVSSCRAAGVQISWKYAPLPSPAPPGHIVAIDGACTKYSSHLKSVIVQQLIFFIVLTVLPWVQFLTFNHHLVQVRPPRCRALRRTTTRRARTPTSSGRIRSTLQRSRRTQPD